MPQNLEDTQFPGAMSKCAVLLVKPKTKEVIAVAPLYTTEQVQEAREVGENLGLTFAETVTIYSLADLDRVGDVEELPKATNLTHKPGCVYAHLDHPGDCYVKDVIGVTVEATGLWDVDSDGTWTLPGPSGTRDGDPAPFVYGQSHAPGCTGLHDEPLQPGTYGQCIVDETRLT
jgi:hypothetical protein